MDQIFFGIHYDGHPNLSLKFGILPPSCHNKFWHCTYLQIMDYVETLPFFAFQFPVVTMCCFKVLLGTKTSS